MIATLADREFELLFKLQASMSRFVIGLGGLVHSDWRKFKTDTKCLPAAQFIDGDLVEMFGGLEKAKQLKILDDMNVASTIKCADLVEIIEEIARIH